MTERFVPDHKFHHFSEITPEFLLSKGICAIVSDIDNTLVTYDDEMPTPEVLEWIDGMQKAGIQIAFISNNTRERVRIFNCELKCFAKGAAKKPFKKYILCAVEAMCVDRHQACMIGDQMFTDVLAGNNAKIMTILVDPLKDRQDVFTRLKRKAECRIINKHLKKKNISNV